MEPLKIGRKMLVPVAIAALCCGATYWFTVSLYDARIAELEQKLSDLEAQERNALVTKRISEQMEDIAYQQKTISDQQRERAEEQSRIADIERGKAEIERSAARAAEQKAVRSAYQADSLRGVAELESERATLHMHVAQASRAKADTLFYNSLGRSLAQTAMQQFKSGDHSLAALLSYSGWYYTKEYGGNQYQQDVFAAIVKSSDADKSLEGIAKGGIRGMQLLVNGKRSSAICMVSDYGEILKVPTTTVTPWTNGVGVKPDVVFANSQYDFRDLLMTGDETAFAIDISGAIANIDFGEARSCVITKPILPYDQWTNILHDAKGNIIVVAKNHMAWLSSDGTTTLRTEYLHHAVTTVGQREDGTPLLFCDDGSITSIANGMLTTSDVLPFLAKDNATAYVFSSRYGYDVIGSESGMLYVCNTDGTLITSLYGHTGRISDMDQFSRMVMTSSYDCTVRIWDLGNLSTMIVPNEMDFDRWPLCFMYDRTVATLQIGFADGAVHSLNISSKSNAECTQQHLEREFTTEEWNYYIGKEVPYKKFMP